MLPPDRLLSAFIVWLRERVLAEEGQQGWDFMVSYLNTPPLSAVRDTDDEEEPVIRPPALPPGAPVGAAEEAVAFDAFLGATGRRG